VRHKIYSLLLLFTLAIAGTAAAQTCPGPAVRTALINLQKSNIVNGTRWGQTVLTDTCGNQRYVTLDSLIVIVVDSIQADTSLLWNWYSANDTTTNLLRTAFVLRSAWWRGIDSVGFLRWSMRPDGFDGSQFTLYQDSVVVDADTIIWKSSWHPELQVHEMQAEGTYFYADSLKVVGIGQFPAFPSLVFDGTDKGYYSAPNSVGFTGLFDGDGQTGGYSYAIVSQLNNLIEFITQPDAAGRDQARISMNAESGGTLWQAGSQNAAAQHNGLSTLMSMSSNTSLYSTYLSRKDTNLFVTLYLGSSSNDVAPYSGARAFGVRLTDTVGLNKKFDWLQIYLPNDTTGNQLSFYNRSYYWRNEMPTGVAGDTLFHFWAEDGTNAGKNPGFMTLDQMCAHCAADAVNWYNSNDITTENTRIADVLETATWRSDDVTQNGVVPFRFELAGVGANEPESMVWAFPNGDSAVIQQADAEIILFTNAFWLLKSDAATTVQADSFQFNPNLGGTAFRVGQYNTITQNSEGSSGVTHKDAIEYNSITGTAQTELFMDGSSAVFRLTQNSNSTFKVHISAICSSAGNGVGITTGESFSGWYLGGVKRIGATSALVGTVQNAATAQADTGMSTSVVTIDADDTDDSLRIRFTPPSTAGSTTVIQVTATIETTQSSY